MTQAKPDFHLEEKHANQGLVIGVDEVGRGPWAGPVMAGAVWINPALLSSLPLEIIDSKKLTASKREYIHKALTSIDIAMAVGQADVEEIDRLNILNATFLAMERACINLQEKMGSNIKTILVDGNRKPIFKVMSEQINRIPIINGDNISLSIAAASIIAKQIRDSYMCNLHGRYPEYGFNRHKGYGTKFHRLALAEFGPTPHHRSSFAPIRALTS
jgi:ribonuclease HII